MEAIKQGLTQIHDRVSIEDGLANPENHVEEALA